MDKFVKRDLDLSMSQFDELIRPVLPQLFGSCEFIRTEGSPEEIAKILDQNIGIDGLIKKGSVYYGLGSRIQSGSGVWNTFTIRKSRVSGHITELEKLRRAIKNDAMRPHFTMHAYVTNNELKSIGVVRTRDLVEYIDNHECKTRFAYDGKAEFVYVNWGDISKEYPVNVLDFQDSQPTTPKSIDIDYSALDFDEYLKQLA